MKIKYVINEKRNKSFVMMFNNIFEVSGLLKYINSRKEVCRKGEFYLLDDVLGLLVLNNSVKYKSKHSKRNYVPKPFQCVLDCKAIEGNFLYDCLKDFFVQFVHKRTVRFIQSRTLLWIKEERLKKLDLLSLYKLYKHNVNMDNYGFTRKDYKTILEKVDKSFKSFIL